MQTDSPELSLLSIFALFTFFIFLLLQKYSSSSLMSRTLDSDFSKPQAFHHELTPRIGGLASIISFILFIFLNNLMFSNFYFDYLFLGASLFLIGFFDDIRAGISANWRLTLMTIVLFFFVRNYDIQINSIDVVFLDNWLKNQLFLNSFLVLCFLFIINGSNLIDGFNGLLSIHLIIINSILFYTNLINGNNELSIIIISQTIILLSFLLFNFPKAKMFFGDSGSYFFGALTALNIIYTNNINPDISSFFFCILLFYLFFEVFFSFFRKIYQGKSPLKPDEMHLHMLMYKYLNIKLSKPNLNFLNSIIINVIFLLVIIPANLMKTNGFFCKYWFFFLLLLYLLLYNRLYSFTKKKIDI